MNQDLYEAARILDDRGLHQGNYGSGKPYDNEPERVCMLGALRIVLFGTPWWNAAERRSPVIIHRFAAATEQLGRYLRENELICGNEGTPAYNDTDGRTKEECVKTLMEAAEWDR